MTTKRGFYAAEIAPHVHQWLHAAGPWPQPVENHLRAWRGNRAIVDTHCRWCGIYSERTIVTRGAWTPNRANRAMERAEIFWS
jgi:hypothetical protein